MPTEVGVTMKLFLKNSRISLFLLLVTIILTLSFYVPTVDVGGNEASSAPLDLGMYYEILRDPTNAITIEELIAGTQDSSFMPSTEKYLSFLHTDDTIWLKLDAADLIQEGSQTHWLEYNDKIEHLNVYVVKEDGSYELFESGLYNLESQPFSYPALLFPIEGSEVKELYLQLNGQLPLVVFTKLYANNSFIETVVSYKFYSGSFYGFLLALGLYNLFLYFSFKERAYLYYTLYMFSFMLFQGTMNSFDVELFGHIVPPWLLTKTLGLSCNVMIVFMILFGKKFLDINKLLPRSNRLLNVGVGLAGLSTIALFVGVNQSFTDIFITTMALFVLIFLWVTALRLFLKGHKSARFYLLGWSFLLFSMMIQALVMLGLLPMSLAVFEEIPAYSAMFEALILSFALVDKITLIIKENRQTQNELNETLEKKVLARTEELEKIQVALQHLANTDRLTQIPNRVLLDRVLEKEFSQSDPVDNPLSIILIDLDYFKKVNDTFGHQVGDEVLVGTAKLFKAAIRTSDTIGRWGGEEFLLICPGTPLTDALALAEKIRITLANHHFPKVGKKTASFGVATHILGDTLHSIISRSDKALYTAKEKGRNRVAHIKMRADV